MRGKEWMPSTSCVGIAVSARILKLKNRNFPPGKPKRNFF
jgi:hypothetical protein